MPPARPREPGTSLGLVTDVGNLLRVPPRRDPSTRVQAALEAWSFIDAVLSSPSLGILVPGERHREVAAQALGEIPHLAGNLMHDAHTAVLMREHGVRIIYTRDTDFHRFGFLEPVDPVVPRS